MTKNLSSALLCKVDFENFMFRPFDFQGFFCNSDCTANASEKAADGTTSNTTTASEPASEKSQITVDWSKSPEDMTVEELQAGILAKMANNGPVTDQMKKTVYDNIWHDSLVNWLKSFR